MVSIRWTGVSCVPRNEPSPFEGQFIYLVDDAGDVQDRVLTIREWSTIRTPGGRERTSGGVLVTDELVERLAAEAEAGYDPDQLRPRPDPPLPPAA